MQNNQPTKDELRNAAMRELKVSKNAFDFVEVIDAAMRQRIEREDDIETRHVVFELAGITHVMFQGLFAQFNRTARVWFAHGKTPARVFQSPQVVKERGQGNVIRTPLALQNRYRAVV